MVSVHFPGVSCSPCLSKEFFFHTETMKLLTHLLFEDRGFHFNISVCKNKFGIWNTLHMEHIQQAN